MTAFLRQLIAAPFRLLLWVCGFFPIIDRLKLAEILWFLTKDPQDGSNLLAFVANQKGIEAAREKAESIFDRIPASGIAATIGWLEVQHGRDLMAASDWLKRVHQKGNHGGHTALGLELFLSEHIEEYDYPEVIEKILQRNDLPGQITRDALLAKAKLLLKAQQWDQAGVIAGRILSIEENPQARWVKWVITTARGDQIKAEAELKLTKGKMTAEALRGFMILGWIYMGDTNRANQLLREFQREKLGLALVSRDLAEFVRDNMDESVIGEAE